MADPKIVVIGAAGFVGRELLRRFETQDRKVTAVVRGFPELSVEGDFHRVVNRAELGNERFDVVINLAYPTSGALFEQAAANKSIIETVDSLVADGGRIVHTSTIAVFGMTLNRPIHVGPVKPFRDMSYVEDKVEAERLLSELQPARSLTLDIVRLGNVWGAASGAWALPVVTNLLTGRPTAVSGTPSFSNTTDVANAADYLLHLAGLPSGHATTKFHHVAEFSAVRWQDWIEPIAEALGVTPVYAEPWWLTAPDGARAEVSAAVAPVGIRSIYQSLAIERVAGSLVRDAIRRMPAPIQQKLRADGIVYAPPPELGRIEQIVLGNMAGEQEFRSSIDDQWSAPVSRDESLARVLRWLS